MIDRRRLLAALGSSSALAPLGALAQTVTMPFANGERPLVTYPQKRPIGIVLLGCVPGSVQLQSLSGMRYAVFIQ